MHIKHILTILILFVIAQRTIAQQDDDPQQAAIVVHAQENAVVESTENTVAEIVEVGVFPVAVRDYRTISIDDLPDAVLRTVRERYHSRGLKENTVQQIESIDGDLYYAVDMVSERTDLFIMLDTAGRVFKAERH